MELSEYSGVGDAYKGKEPISTGKFSTECELPTVPNSRLNRREHKYNLFPLSGIHLPQFHFSSARPSVIRGAISFFNIDFEIKNTI